MWNGRSVQQGSTEICATQRARWNGLSPQRGTVNEFDLWWVESRRPNVRNGEVIQSQGWRPEALPFDRASVTKIFTDFVQSDFAKQTSNICNINPTDYGRIEGMFEFVRLENPRLVLKLKKNFQGRAGVIFDRLAKYIHVRIPQVAEIHSLHKDGVNIL
jgi:hypothetical protein